MEVQLGGNRLGSESKFPTIELDGLPRSNQNLSKINRFTAQIGLLYPSYLQKVLAGDIWKCKTTGLFKTMPLQGPLFGSFKVQQDFFFIPLRLYNKYLHMNKKDFNPADIKRPIVIYERAADENAADPYTDPMIAMSEQVNPSSLAHFLGVTSLGDQATGPRAYMKIQRATDGTPALGYLDIYVNYYANQQEKVGYIVRKDAVIEDEIIADRFLLSGMDKIRELIYKSPTGTITIPDDTQQTEYNFINHITKPQTEFTGLCIKTHLSDKFNNWLDSASIERITQSTRVAVTDNAFSIDALRLSNKVNEMKQRITVSNGTFDSWLTSMYGKSVKLQREIPEWIGSNSSEIVFEDIQSTTDFTDPEGEVKPLGWKSGSGRGEQKQGYFEYNINEPGFIMGIFSITPRVDYSTGNRNYLKCRTLEEDHVSALDQIGFQDLLADEMASVLSQVDENGEITNTIAVGKQPAWLDYMTETNETHGDFAINGSLSYMVLNKDYFGQFGDEENTGVNYTTYINPAKYNKIFADASAKAQNFWIQFAYEVNMSRVMSKKVMPKL